MTRRHGVANGAVMMTPRKYAAAGLAALFVVAGCNKEPEVVGGPVDPQANELKSRPPVQLPPSIKEAHTYRCKDNSLVHLTFLNDNVTVVVREREGGEPPLATLTAPAAGQPFAGNGYTVTGSGSNVTYTAPGKARLTCRS